MLLQNTILQQPSTLIQSCFKCQKPKRNSISCGCHRLGTNENSKRVRMPRFLIYMSIYMKKIRPKTSPELIEVMSSIGQ